MSEWLGLDIGGANLKIADTGRFAWNQPFAMWKYPGRLSAAIHALLHRAPNFSSLAITMTGEMADCFATREEGVCRILEQVTQVIPSSKIRVYAVDGNWWSPAQAARRAWMIASANWHALARYASQWSMGEGTLLVDIGSTTTDIIPIIGNRVATDATTDSQRLQRLQLVYSGVERTTLCAMVRTLPFQGVECPVMAEHFATVRDAYVWIGELPEDPEDRDTADGQPMTRRHAAYRLARMIGEDGSTLVDDEIDLLAEAVARQQAEQLSMAMIRQRQGMDWDTCRRVISTGHGDFLLDAALGILGWCPIRFSLREELGPDLSRCATARAIACLAAKECGVAA